MDEEGKKPQVKREITYQVGWKKGKMGIGDQAKPAAPNNAAGFERKPVPSRLLDAYVWREAPFVPKAALPVLLWLFPAFSFGIIWWLVYMLSKP